MSLFITEKAVLFDDTVLFIEEKLISLDVIGLLKHLLLFDNWQKFIIINGLANAKRVGFDDNISVNLTRKKGKRAKKFFVLH